MLTRARSLRVRQVFVERRLWQQLRAKRFHGIKFRRQVPIGPYIVDFLQVDSKLVIELDGSSHWQVGAQEYDAIRDDYLRCKGFRVIRFQNHEVIFSFENVLSRIKALSLTLPHKGRED